jgi:hypothetical protein
VLIAGCVAFDRRGNDQRSFTLAIGVSLTLTPIVWLHYFVLLLVSLPVAWPRFAPLRELPIVLWPSFHPLGPGGYATLVPALVTAVILYWLLTQPSPKVRPLPSPEAPMVSSG